MRRFFYLSVFTFIALAMIFNSCKKDEDKNLATADCNVNDPLVELPWLNTALDEVIESNDFAEYAYLMSASYNDQTVFYFGNCHPAINSYMSILNCEGEVIGGFNDLTDALTNHTVLWQHENSHCNFNN